MIPKTIHEFLRQLLNDLVSLTKYCKLLSLRLRSTKLWVYVPFQAVLNRPNIDLQYEVCISYELCQ